MSISIPQVENKTKVISAEFVKLTISTSTYTFSTAYKIEIVDGVEYTPLGGLLGIGQQQRDLQVTSFDTTLSLSGIDPSNIQLVLGTPIRGSKIEIFRGFYNEDYEIVNFVRRFTGVVTGYNIAEEREANNNTFSVAINCSSYKTVLENNIGGRRTNRDTWDYFYGRSDTSMDNVDKLNGAYFDFGVPVK
jgi:hypothetical protein